VDKNDRYHASALLVENLPVEREKKQIGLKSYLFLYG